MGVGEGSDGNGLLKYLPPPNLTKCLWIHVLFKRRRFINSATFPFTFPRRASCGFGTALFVCGAVLNRTFYLKLLVIFVASCWLFA